MDETGKRGLGSLDVFAFLGGGATTRESSGRFRDKGGREEKKSTVRKNQEKANNP